MRLSFCTTATYLEYLFRWKNEIKAYFIILGKKTSTRFSSGYKILMYSLLKLYSQAYDAEWAP